VELTGVGSCDDVAHLPPLPLSADAASPAAASAADASSCYVAPPVRKAVLLVVDGLRWDVAAGRAASAVAGRNLSLPSLAALVSASAHSPSPAVLLPFVADPPTTTQQRLKGLLTGAHALAPRRTKPHGGSVHR
jgi:phosphatidylinositol glycan class O